MSTIFVVMAGRHEQQPDSAFSTEAAAAAYAERQNGLERQRHPHPAVVWKVYPLEVDTKN